MSIIHDMEALALASFVEEETIQGIAATLSRAVGLLADDPASREFTKVLVAHILTYPRKYVAGGEFPS